jgi:outer membrane protein OmpA-like peptidoglycan-associated protein
VAIVGGWHQSKVIEENDIPGWDSLKNNFTGRSGIHAGFMADLRLSEKSNFYFQPGVFFFTKGRNYQTNIIDSLVVLKTATGPGRPPAADSIVNTTYFESRKQFLNYIDIPFNLVYKLKLGKKVKFIVGAGPYVSFFYNGSEKTDQTLVNVKHSSEENEDLPVGKGEGKYEILNYGVNGLAGFEIGRIFLTANYSRGLNDFYKPSAYTATEYKHEVMGASLGIFLGKAIKEAPKDTDGDGTPDKTDKCPGLAGPAKLLGCPDTDQDGIPDSEDKCPGEAGAADNDGCPYKDKDGDGILDKDDKCVDITGPIDNGGCPYPDTDKDSIIDKDDKCPEVFGLARYQGCPVPDTDGDGINDEDDKCADVKGVAANGGCPEEIKQEIVQKVAYAAKRIQFKVSSAELTSGSFKVLDEVALILSNNPDIKVTIEGHTSADGTYAKNMILSESRANTVKTYLESKGIDASRLTAIGFGPDKPLNPGKTVEEKAANRRVELNLSNQ